ncbi:MAG: hypothetical protein IPM56_18575 [Ignavibacteriales bacterium]|nr:MAG: hypothetical protein IPM56_18575 [Ignavibacteriales bacterium]
MKPNKFLLLFLSLYIINCTLYITHATTRYVSKTGSSTPPYTSWETAADSIQKAIDLSWIDDTIIVANGTYYESLYINRTIHLIGSSMDSTIIDGTNILGYDIIYFFENNSTFKNFTIKSSNPQRNGIVTRRSNLIAEFCKINSLEVPLNINFSSVNISSFIINAFYYAIRDECPSGLCNSVYSNNIITSSNSINTPIYFSFGGNPTFTNNIVIEQGNTLRGVGAQYNVGIKIMNNIVSGYDNTNIQVGQITTDYAYLENNISLNAPNAYGSSTAHRTIIRNNIAKDVVRGFQSGNGTVIPDYNLFWNVTELVSGTAILGDSNIVADPMFVKDTIPNSQLDFDYHLQKYSPAIDKGNPNILDVDGSRSDIGIFGGPLGQKYTYMDLAPKPPRNLIASLDSGLVHLTWNKNTEADLFRYRVYRDTVPDFIYDPTKLIAVVADTFYYDDVPDRINSGNYYYKLTAIDTAVNQSAASEEVHVTITGIPEAPPVVVEHFRLLQNYPNPFNPSTTIPYRLKEGGYVKVMVYDIKGELVRVLVNQYQSAGYYEVEFSPNKTERKKAEGYVEFETGYYGNVASGIYLYRIEVIGEGRIPVYSDMKKMLMLK